MGTVGTGLTSALLPRSSGLERARGRTLAACFATLVVLVALTAANAVLGIGGQALQEPIRDWVSSGIYVLVAVVVALRAVCDVRQRAPWAMLALVLVLFAIGNVLWSSWIGHLHNIPIPSVCDGLWLALYPLSYAGIVGLARAHGQHRLPAGVWLDGLIAGTGLAALGAALVFSPVLASASGSSVAVATELAYPIGDLLMAALVVGVIALNGWRVNRMWGLLVGGFLLLAIADCLYADQIAHGAANPSPMTNFAYVFAVAVLAFAAWQTDDQVQTARLERWSMLTLPACFALTALGLLIYDHWHRIDDLALSFSIITLLAAIGRMAFTFRDISGLAEATRQAKTDDLTGLPNRRAFVQRTAGAIRAARLAAGSISVMLLDLDGFKELNDTLGHPAGDELLALVGPRVQGALRETDLVARIGGDEFAVILDPDPDPAATGRVAQKILDAFRDPFEVDGVALRVTASMGIARFPADADSADDLIKRADVAMYLAKSARSGYALYASARDTNSRARLVLAGELEAALQDGAIEVHFQPKAAAGSRRIVGVEALARWRQADGTLVPPSRFIDAAERAGLARALTTTVLDLALTQIATWRAAGYPISVSVNTTVPDLLDTDFPGQVSDLLAAHGLEPAALILEVTERSVLSDPVRIGGILARLNELGVGLSLDDFGTGFSSLAHLRTLPVTEVKVDRSFVSGLNTDPRDRAIVDAIIRLAHELEIRVVAEGIEDQQTWDTLTGLGCDLIQGYALSRPGPADEIEHQLEAALVIRRSSIGSALESLVGNADVITARDTDRPRITDPMFELWLQSRGLTPESGEDSDDEL